MRGVASDFLFVNSLYRIRGVVDSAYGIADAESRRLASSRRGSRFGELLKDSPCRKRENLAKIQTGINFTVPRVYSKVWKKGYLVFSLCLPVSLKVPSGQIGSAWEWYQWIGLEKDINRCRFFIFDFSSEYLKQLQSSEPLRAKRPLILLLVRVTACMCSNRDLFRRTMLHLNAGEISIVLWIAARK